MAEIAIPIEISASVWKIEAVPGARVAAGDILLILESMKMEIPVEAPQDGIVAAILVAEGDQVKEGQVVVTLTA
jgi:biotin carboxyl carrier protein